MLVNSNSLVQWDELERLSYLDKVIDNSKPKILDLSNYKLKERKFKSTIVLTTTTKK
jgi:hypothetical protein